MNELVSVVITTYNRKNLLIETLRSVRTQTWENIEVIVVDDGSNEMTFSGDEVAEQGIRYFYICNVGQPSARNFGISKAKGKYVAFVDDDDLWCVDKIEKQMAAIERGARWVACDCRYLNSETGEVYGLHSRIHSPASGDVFVNLLKNCFIASPTVLVERKLLIECGMFFDDRHLRFGEDWFMWLRIAARTGLVYIDEPLATYRVHGASMLSSANIDEIAMSHRIGLDRVFESLPAEYSKHRKSSKVFDNRKIAKIAYGAGDLFNARKYAYKAFRQSKSSVYSFFLLLAVHLPLQRLRKFAKWRR